MPYRPASDETFRNELAGRLRQLQGMLFTRPAIARMARSIGIPDRTWRNYLEGAQMPATAVLSLMHRHGVNARWLLDGTGPVFREHSASGSRAILRSNLRVLFEGVKELVEVNDASGSLLAGGLDENRRAV